MYKQFNIEKVKDDGTKLELRINLMDGNFRLEDIGVKPKGKRKFTYICGSNLTNDYDYRRLNHEDRMQLRLNKMLEVCPVELINEAMEEAWLSIKPEKFS